MTIYLLFFSLSNEDEGKHPTPRRNKIYLWISRHFLGALTLTGEAREDLIFAQ